MEVQSYANVWEALKDTPEAAAAMTLRSELIAALDKTVRGWGITQSEARDRPEYPSGAAAGVIPGGRGALPITPLQMLACGRGLDAQHRGRHPPAEGA